MGTQHRKHLEQPRIDQIPPPKERTLKTGFHALELDAILSDKTTKARRVSGNDRRNFPLHAPEIGCRIQLAPFTKNDPVLRIEPDKVDLVAKTHAR